MKKRYYQDYLKDILDSINDIESFIGSMSFDEFKKDKKTINAVVRSIEVIGEATKNIPKIIKNRHKEVPWKKMAGMRDKLIHEYFGIDIEILWKTATEDIPPLKKPIQNILESLKRNL
ncbi:MAG: DUF86 domain-containing protein [Thermoproteota archaeon]